MMSHCFSLLLQTLPQTNLKDDWVVIGAALIIVAMQTWSLRNTTWLKTEVVRITTHLFGVGSDGGQVSVVDKLQKAHEAQATTLAETDKKIELISEKVANVLRRIESIERIVDRRYGPRRHNDEGEE